MHDEVFGITEELRVTVMDDERTKVDLAKPEKGANNNLKTSSLDIH